MLERVYSRNSRILVLVHQLFNQILGLVANLLPNGPVKGPGSLLDFSKDLRISLAINRSLTAEHHIDDHADAPQVTLFCVFAQEHLRCNVEGSTVFLCHGVVT